MPSMIYLSLKYFTIASTSTSAFPVLLDLMYCFFTNGTSYMSLQNPSSSRIDFMLMAKFFIDMQSPEVKLETTSSFLMM